MDGGSKSTERLIGADVRSGFLAANVLLAGGEREDETALSCGVNGLAGQAAGHLADEFVTRCDYPCERAAIARRKTETLRFHCDNIGFGGRLNGAQGNTLCDRDNKQGTGRMSDASDFRTILEHAKKVGRLQNDGAGVSLHGAFERRDIHGAILAVANLFNLQAG